MNYQEIEINDFRAISSNNSNPNKNDAEDILNLVSDEKLGYLTLQQKYSLLYNAPSAPNLTINRFIGYETFYAKRGDSLSPLIHIAVASGVVSSPVSGLSDTQEVAAIFARPYWNGTSWVDAWKWINPVHITSINQTINNENKSRKFVNGVQSFTGWTVYNKTRQAYAYVVYTSDEFPSNNTSIVNISVGDNDWDLGDVLIFMDSYIPIEVHQALSQATIDEVSFHKLNNELRIGFGGQKDRIALAVQFVQKYFYLQGFDFTSLGVDLSSEAVIKNSVKTDGLVVSPFNALTDSNVYQVRASEGAAGELEAGRYFVRLTAVLDGYAEFIVAQSQVEIAANKSVSVLPFVKFGQQSKRLTGFRIWISKGAVNAVEPSTPFYLLDELYVSDDSFAGMNWRINSEGFYYPDSSSSTELNTGSHALSLTNDADSKGDWTARINGAPLAGASFASERDAILNEWYLILENNSDGARYFDLSLEREGLFRKGRRYKVIFRAKGSITGLVVRPYISDGFNVQELGAPVSPSIDSVSSFVVEFDASYAADTLAFQIDSIPMEESIKFYSVSILSYYNDEFTTYDEVAEMTSALGYANVNDFVNGYDQAILLNKRVYYLNPYFDKRYNGYVAVSEISGDGANMYDVATFADYLRIEKFDGQDLIALAPLPNGELIAFRDNSYSILDPETNFRRDVSDGVGCVSRKSIVLIDNTVFWADKKDIFAINPVSGYVPQNLTESTLRDKYNTVQSKGTMIGVRDVHGRYRLRTSHQAAQGNYDFIFTNRGWVRHEKEDFPIAYANSSDTVYFLDSAGRLHYYNDNASGGYNFLWESIEFSIDEMGQEITMHNRILLNALSLRYEASHDFKMEVQLFKKRTETLVTKEYTIKATDKYAYKLLPPAMVASKFKVVLSGQGVSSMTIKSLGISLGILNVGHHG